LWGTIARGGGNAAPYTAFTTTIATIRFQTSRRRFRTVLVGHVPLTRRFGAIGQQGGGTRGTIARGSLADIGIDWQDANICRRRWRRQCFGSVAGNVRLEAALWHAHKGIAIRTVGIGPDTVLIQTCGAGSGTGANLGRSHFGWPFFRF
jgi:hypothetical protein